MTCGARLAVALVLPLLAGACAREPAWGVRARPWPGLGHVRHAAVTAACDPHTWVPLAGAALLQIGDADGEIAAWARRERPLFGSTTAALDWSESVRDTTRWVGRATILATPNGRHVGAALWGKAKGAAVELGAVWLQGQAITGLKDAWPRDRPDGSGRDSLPSGHTGEAAAYAALARRNLETLPLSCATRRLADGAFTAAAAATGWARIEAGRHRPSDVLVGAAIGNFVALFVHDAFLGRSPGGPRLGLRPGRDGVEVAVSGDL